MFCLYDHILRLMIDYLTFYRYYMVPFLREYMTMGNHNFQRNVTYVKNNNCEANNNYNNKDVV